MSLRKRLHLSDRPLLPMSTTVNLSEIISLIEQFHNHLPVVRITHCHLYNGVCPFVIEKGGATIFGQAILLVLKQVHDNYK